jgi:hypothetical protein
VLGNIGLVRRIASFIPDKDQDEERDEDEENEQTGHGPCGSSPHRPCCPVS